MYRKDEDGIYKPLKGVLHREEEYHEVAFEVLARMQKEHFWYQGRHAFLLAALRRLLAGLSGPRAIDLGGGCGGWLAYLNEHEPARFAELALGDSSLEALQRARSLLLPHNDRYQIDLLHLDWSERWDCIFLLDVLEHIPQDQEVLQQVWQALRPGGLLFVTTPALKFFWSQNDSIVGHQTRYSRNDFERLARACGFQAVLVRYFMFFLSPLYFASRLLENRRSRPQSPAEVAAYLDRTHRVPARPLNQILAAIFGAEARIGLDWPFPWGTSLLGVLQKPVQSSGLSDSGPNGTRS